MWVGKYKKINPLPEFSGMRFEVEAVHDDWEGFRIWFRPHDATKAMVIAKFDSELFYSTSHDGDRLSGAKNDISDEFPHLFWEVTDSSLINEFKRQTAGIRAEDAIYHYCFMSCNQAVDVLSLSAPMYIGHEI